VRIAVRAFSLNFGDLLCVKGLYPTMPPYPFTPGIEASGVVVLTGSAVTSIREGDAVIVGMGESLGGQASMITCKEENVFAKPEELSHEEACALPAVAITMIDAFRKARLKRGERILIQTAAGGIGLIAVQLAQHHGAEIYATAGSSSKLDYLRKLGVPYRINYLESDFEEEVARLTQGKGVDVVINTLSGDAIQKGLRCLSPGGRYIEIAMTALKSAKSIDLSVLNNNQSVFSIDLRKLGLESPETIQEYRRELSRLVADKIIQPTVSQVFPLDRIRDAYQSLQGRKNIGKIVVTIPEIYQFRETAPVGEPSVINADGVRDASSHQEPIAIIGMSGRFAKSADLDELWKHLANGDDLVEEVTRWDLTPPEPPVPGKKSNYCKVGSFLDDIDRFDPLFFKISALEATYMDPQQRLFLEESWKALEDAGYAGKSVEERSCGVYVGCVTGDYQKMCTESAPAQAFWGNSGSVIPARISYFLNLKGPAIAVDTACSSSLVSIHLACQGLWAGETEMALAGGVFVQSTPQFHNAANRAGMLSAGGHCRAFDDKADGFVPGEGVGVVVLKRLSESLADGDHIYAVLAGSGINQDGTSNGITAPSASSQERLETSVYETFRIDPEQIQMVEAHGTGTILGDPIEYEALTRSFRKFTDKKDYCALGSIKTNIGHAATAAGIAGVVKILLALKHRQIPASLHFEAGNSDIQFQTSPFYVNTRLREWEVAAGAQRHAAISSFGFSGTNAHMVFREAPAAARRHHDKPGYLIVLSACSAQQLRQLVEKTLAYCKQEQPIDCGNMSYTLLLGRKHFHHRLAVVVRSPKELVKLFRQWLGKGKVSQVYVSELSETEHREQPALRRYGNECIQNCGNTRHVTDYLECLAAIGDLFVQGYDLEFGKLFAGDPYSRVSLPTYPFAKEHYWISERESRSPGPEKKTPFVHPLLQRNTSDPSKQRFSSTFTGSEFFLWDHVVQGQHVLPGVAYLEMARAAVALAAGNSQIHPRLKNVVWTRPLAVEREGVQVHIALSPEDNGQIAYAIYSDRSGAQPIVHSQGRAVLVRDEGQARLQPARLSLADLQAECSEQHLPPAQLYDAFRAMGIDYGPAHRCLKEVHVGKGQVLARLSLPASIVGTLDQYVLHPSLLDSALQASMGLMSGTGGRVSLPFALAELTIFRHCSPNMWALVRLSDESAGERVQKLDIDLCDDAGTICVSMKGFTARVLEGRLRSQESTITETLMWKPEWREQRIIERGRVPVYAQHVVLLCELNPDLRDLIESELPGVRCRAFKSEDGDIGDRFQSVATRAFEEIRSIFREGLQGYVLVQILSPVNEYRQLSSSLSVLLKTAQKESPKVIGQSIGVEYTDNILAIIRENSRIPQESQVRYQAGKRWIAGWREVEATAESVVISWKENGIYLISGGAGGLGLIFAKEIAQQARNARVIVTGRSPFDPAKWDQVGALGARIVYRQVDVTKKRAVEQLLQSISAEFGSVNGIIHSAGVIRDRLILKKDKDEFLAVLAPKVLGVVNLDEASKDLNLDFFVCFSSAVGALGNAGQADYATANAFMDAYALYRNRLVLSRERHGRTLSINWPLWKEGRMRFDPNTERLAREATGLQPLETSNGIEAFYRAMASGESQVMVAEGEPIALKRSFRTGFLPQAAAPKNIINDFGASARDRVLNLVKTTLGEVIQLSPEKIQAETPFATYGLDSILQMKVISALERVTGELPKTLLFEQSNTRELVDHLVEHYSVNFAETGGAVPAQGNAPEFVEAISPQIHHPHIKPGDDASSKRATEDIAVIGISGRYPLSANLSELWKHLKAGDNCISEPPPDRWRTSLVRLLSGERFRTTDRRYYGGFLEEIDRFDHYLFEVNRGEVMSLPPELRLFLEIAWETFEDAGYTRRALTEFQTKHGLGVGVFVGTMYSQYPWSMPSLEQAVLSSNGTDWQIANRTSHFFNLTGPSIAINSACSSSLTAIHLACESLKHGNCSMAIAGGINLTLDPSKYDSLQHAGFLGSGNQSKSLGVGDGYIPGEGVGAVLLKLLSMAIRDKDRVDAVIKGSFVNHSGGRQLYSVPDPRQQATLIAASIQRSGIDPSTIGYVESAANGSKLGDPIEVIALNNAFRQYTDKQEYCALGSVKSNLGHLEAASGMSQLSKVILQLRHKTLVPSINASPRNPNIRLERTAFHLQEQALPWQPMGHPESGKALPRRAMINSFGAGGAYANLVLEEHAGGLGVPAAVHRERLFIVSAKTKSSLKGYLAKMEDFLRENDTVAEESLAWSLLKRNHDLENRAAILASSIAELAGKLNWLHTNERSSPDSGIYVSFDRGSDQESGILQDVIANEDPRGLAERWVGGATVDFTQFEQARKCTVIPLPAYAFDHGIGFTVSAGELPEGETARFDDDFCQDVADKIANGELSEGEFVDLMTLQ
jgi:acyl transferase domain-containing protein/threonine dehydrogenase-like Zn-dependent dehydrogenase